MYRQKGFTLSEVLITLGIIGVVAALTMPIIVKNVQKIVLKNQFKKSYSLFSQGVMQAQTNLDAPVRCSAWLTGQKCKTACTKRNDYGTCSAYTCADGTPIPYEENGPVSDCKVFMNELFTNVFKVSKFCEKNALKNGCITSSYRGIDKVKAELYPNTKVDPNSGFSDIAIKKGFYAWILSSGEVIITNVDLKGSIYNPPEFLIDINGHKSPNKFGYDIFSFTLRGDENGIQKIDPSDNSIVVEKGGKTATQMLRE